MGELSLKRLWVLMVTAFVDMLGYALILPLLPLYAQDFGASPAMIGAILASWALAQLLTAPLWGRLSDRVGRRPVILGGQLMAMVAFLFFAMADSIWFLLLCRLAQGVGAGTVSAIQAYVSDSIAPEKRAEALGWITASTSAGVMIGPALGSFSLSWTQSDAAPGLIAAGLCALNILFAWRWLPEPDVPRVPRTAEAMSTSSGWAIWRHPVFKSIGAVVAHPMRRVHTLILIYSSGMMAFMAVASILALYVSDRFGVGKEEVGYFYVATGAVSVVMRALVLGALIKSLGEVRVLRLGIIVLAAGLILMPLATNPWVFLAFLILSPTGTALLFPSTTSLISRYADPGETGQIHGVQHAFGGTSRLLAPLFAGWIYGLCPPASEMFCAGSLPFWMSGVVVSVTVFLSLRLRPGEAPRPELEATTAVEA